MKREQPRRHDSGKSQGEAGRLRIIGGSLRSRIIDFSTDPRTRPMKDRTREAIFNLLGGKLQGYVAFDLFAGSGILAIESLSRGAGYAIALELLPRASHEIRQNAVRLGVADRLCVMTADAFQWTEKLPAHLTSLAEGAFAPLVPSANRELDGERPYQFATDVPWCIFVSPPYRLWETHTEALQALLERWIAAAPNGSLFAVELDISTPLAILPTHLDWQTRAYRPAMMAIAEKAPLAKPSDQT